jgi:hypothetical protein
MHRIAAVAAAPADATQHLLQAPGSPVHAVHGQTQELSRMRLIHQPGQALPHTAQDPVVQR